MEKKPIIEQIKEKLKQEMLSYTNRDWIKLVLLCLFTMLIGALAIKYLLQIVYTITMATDPCNLCKELNPGIELVRRININWSNFTP